MMIVIDKEGYDVSFGKGITTRSFKDIKDFYNLLKEQKPVEGYAEDWLFWEGEQLKELSYSDKEVEEIIKNITPTVNTLFEELL